MNRNFKIKSIKLNHTEKYSLGKWRNNVNDDFKAKEMGRSKCLRMTHISELSRLLAMALLVLLYCFSNHCYIELTKDDGSKLDVLSITFYTPCRFGWKDTTSHMFNKL